MQKKVTLGGNSGIKKVEIGGESPVSIQTMWKQSILPALTDADFLLKLLKEIDALAMLGCDILRFAVPDMQSADALIKIAAQTSMPLVADIHYDHKLALRCLDGKIAKIRINPGNIGSIDKTQEVVHKCAQKGVPIRIGVNTGSFPADIAQKVDAGVLSRASGLCESALRELEVFDALGFDQTVVSIKASSVAETIEANTKFAAKSSVPLHIGVTEAGPLIGGIVKSTIAFTKLLEQNIGNTLRVSLSSTAENEVIAAREILRECGKRTGGIKIVSCPRCGRLGFDVHAFVERWQTRLLSMQIPANKDFTIAVMGCTVNGPGEGKHADLGITGNGNSVLIFAHGEIVTKTTPEKADDAFFAALNTAIQV